MPCLEIHIPCPALILDAPLRIAPLKVINIVRLELCGAVVSKRLRDFVCKEVALKFERVIHLVDSEAMINLKSYGFNTFAENRIGEIHQGCYSNEWFWVCSELNISDLITRGCEVSQILEDSEWATIPDTRIRGLANKAANRHQGYP